MKYTDIKSQADACKVLGREVKPGEELKDIADAINHLDNKHKPKPSDWRPYFYMEDKDPEGTFGFSGSLCGNWGTVTFAGSRLCFRFRTEEQSDYFGEEFVELHKKHFFS